MTQKDIRKFFKNFNYKSIDFTLKFKDGQVTVTGRRELFHPRSGRSAGVLEASEVFNYRTCTEFQLLSAMRDWLHLVECHEADENIFYKGDQLFYPHAAKESLY